MTRTYRRAYTKSKRFDKSCRSHGGCPWCYGNRTHRDRVLKQEADLQVRLLYEGYKHD